jgi:hypothetical protein
MKQLVYAICLALGLGGNIATPPATALAVGSGAIIVTLASADEAAACEEQVAVEDCGTHVPDVTYGGGGKAVKTVKATACFAPQTAYDITLRNGQYRFVAAFVYKNEQSHERIKDVRGRVAKRGDPVCWTHNVAPGSYMAVWVTCQTPDGQPYEGWVAVRITKAGTYEMKFRPDWNWRPSWL